MTARSETHVDRFTDYLVKQGLSIMVQERPADHGVDYVLLCETGDGNELARIIVFYGNPRTEISRSIPAETLETLPDFHARLLNPLEHILRSPNPIQTLFRTSDRIHSEYE